MRRLALATAVAALLVACGNPPSPPSAKDILAKPQHSGLKDAHFVLTGKVSNQGVTTDLNGEGDIVYRSPGAGRFKFRTPLAGQEVTIDFISINGTDYTFTTPGNGKWTAHPSNVPLGPETFAGESGWTYVGEENLSQGKAWHAKAKDKQGDPFDAWIRESDGYPLKITPSKSDSTLTLTFDKYNSGVTITPPPASQVVQG